MIRTSIFLHSKKRCKSLYVICSLLIILIVMQSTFASETNNISNQNSDTFVMPALQKPLINAVIMQSADLIEQDSTQDECVDCDASCCSCCANTLLASIVLLNKIKTPVQVYCGNKLARFKTPYYSLLRPPKF